MKEKYTLPAKLRRKIGKAMHDYAMFATGDRVLVAISGGVDSLVLACILYLWQKKAPVQFDLQPVHIDHGFWREKIGLSGPEVTIGGQLNHFSIELQVEQEWKIEKEQRTCYLCARNRRSQLFDYAREHGFNKIALGHHKDDLVETFMLNAMYSGNISTMVPKQQLFGGTLSIVRPMAYVDKKDIVDLAARFGLSPGENLCPLSVDTRREKVRSFLQRVYKEEPNAKNSLFAALSNVRKDYLL